MTSIANSGAFAAGFVEVATDTTLDDTHCDVVTDCSSGNVILTLPSAASCEGRVYIVKRKEDTTSNTLTLTCDGSDTILGLSSLTTALSGQTLMLQSNGVDEWVVSQPTPYGAAFGLIGRLIGANMNVTTDQSVYVGRSKYTIRKILVTNASTSLTTAVGGVYTGASKTGVTVVANTQVYSTLTASSKFVDLTLASGVAANVMTAASLFLSLTTPQGAAATADVYVYGEVLEV